MIKETFISFETAVLAKEKGFGIDWDIPKLHGFAYNIDSGKFISTNQFKPSIPHALAPAQHLLQKWLRETHKIHIEIALENFTDGYIWQYQILEGIGECYTTKYFDGEFKSYETTLEVGLYESLKLIKN